MPFRKPRRGREEEILDTELGVEELPEEPMAPPVEAPLEEPVLETPGVDPLVGEITTAAETALAEVDPGATRKEKIEKVVAELERMKRGPEEDLGGLREEGLGLEGVEPEEELMR